MIYLDASVLLEIYLGQSKAEQARRILADEAPKVSSALLGVEVPVTLRRVLSGPNAALLQPALARFDADARGISLFEGLGPIVERVRHDARLSRCRSLDDAHAATALHLLATTGHVVRFATFDARLRSVALSVGLEVLEDSPVPQ